MVPGGPRRVAVLLSSVLVLGTAAVVTPPAYAATPTPADCTIFVVNGQAIGTSGPDVICGTEGDDLILGGGGDDTIFGFGGNDYIDSGAGADWISGGYGADEIELGPGDDYVNGGPGSDRLWGQDGLDDLVGGSGDDALVGGAGSDDLDGGVGVDYCRKDTADTLLSCYFDTSRPQLVGVAVGTPTVDTSQSARVVSVRVRVKDTGTGVGTIALIFARHLTNGQWVNQLELSAMTEGADQFCTSTLHAPAPTTDEATVCLVSGTSRDGVYELRKLLPRWAATGNYILSSVKLRDMANNSGGLWWDKLVEARMAVSFKQTGPGDAYSPLVRSIGLITPSVDTSGAARVVGMRVRITDATSGLAGASFGWARVERFSDGSIRQYLFPQPELAVVGADAVPCAAGVPTPAQLNAGDVPWSCRESGTLNDGWYRAWTVLPRWTGKGVYVLASVGTRDRAGNSKWMMDAELTVRGLDSHFYQSGTGDEIAPTASSVQVMTPSVSSGVDTVEVKVRVRLKDAVSGPSAVYLRFEAPSGTGQGVELVAYPTSCSGPDPAWCPVSGTLNDGVYEATGWLPAHAAAGTWTMTSLEVQDRAGNIRNYWGAYVPDASFVNS